MITKTEIKEIPGRACHYNNRVTKDVMEFHNSGWDACEVNIAQYKSVESACNAYRLAIKRSRVGVAATIRNGRLFLIRDGN